MGGNNIGTVLGIKSFKGLVMENFQVNGHQCLRLVNICTQIRIILPAWHWHVLFR